MAAALGRLLRAAVSARPPVALPGAARPRAPDAVRAGGRGGGSRGGSGGTGAMFLTAVAQAKSKAKYVLVKMRSTAETGYCFNIRRPRLQEKLVLLRYDPIAKQRVLFTERKKIRSM